MLGCRAIYTRDVDASGEAARGRVGWPGPRHEFTATSANAMLCFELRNLRDRTDAGRSQLGKAGSRNVFDSLGSVRSSVHPNPLQHAATGRITAGRVSTCVRCRLSPHLHSVGPTTRNPPLFVSL